MIIYDKSDNLLLDIPVDDTSYRYRAIRQGDKVYLYFSLTEHVEMPVGSYIDYQGQRYTLWRPEDLTKHVTEPVYQLDDNGQKVIGEDLDGDGKPVHRVCKFNN